MIPKMKGKTCIVTGANSGIGKAIAVSLARMGAGVVMVCRNPERGAEALSEVSEKTRGDQLALVIGDVGTIASTKKLAEDLLARCDEIHVLINNAGVFLHELTINEDRLETSFAVNHIGPFVLSRILLDRLRRSAPARIVNVGAKLYLVGKLDLERTPYGHDFSRYRTYANTKLCNVLFTAELARRIESSGVTANVVHPGVVRTKIGATTGLMGTLVGAFMRFGSSPEKGAEPVVWLATAPELEGVSGKYFDLTRERPLNKAARDREVAGQLWEQSARLAGLD
jgi:NAD(P)-dependent dehydrogenase (short-subunit alcohol dehydrogenase family)